mmetsp:Transcript_5951/g.9148  ORF Transcript_5951/g.9148 Transcript_5951/m.9148 type:complete len:221 (+) Transcript_5951:133-795(+)|eukprot:CAMPEP_0184650494 /NCGR_PEP_ID=MMETSP0308-20130426/8015_1 /TAXON_ID=38269 /ORGANISM="Gloeochaete witrockiana, Strain SAG 46.84" /LENGTH=220 /DNA_ID=CAMNT_0027084039 /DNA_START=131 /DNA_END=793 /DNA_ORIENTATION=-
MDKFAFVSCAPVLSQIYHRPQLHHDCRINSIKRRRGTLGSFSFYGRPIQIASKFSRDPLYRGDFHLSIRAEGFEVFPKLLGTWLNDCRVYDAALDEVKHNTSKVIFEIDSAGEYLISSTQNDSEGNQHTVRFVGKPQGEDTLEFSLEDNPDKRVMIAKEHRDNMILSDIFDPKSGRLIAVEVMTLTDPETRIQTGQRFSEDGDFTGTWVYKGIRLDGEDD